MGRIDSLFLCKCIYDTDGCLGCQGVKVGQFFSMSVCQRTGANRICRMGRIEWLSTLCSAGGCAFGCIRCASHRGCRGPRVMGVLKSHHLWVGFEMLYLHILRVDVVVVNIAKQFFARIACVYDALPVPQYPLVGVLLQQRRVCFPDIFHHGLRPAQRPMDFFFIEIAREFDSWHR